MFISRCKKYIINAAILKNGPYGISCSFFDFKIINDDGRAIKADKNIVIIDISQPITIPNMAINFMSPPPRLSFLNMKSPNSFKPNIIKKAITPPIIESIK